MAFEIKPAVRERVNLRICLAGESGSGKTHSALMLAAGISGDKRPLVIDTESRKSLMDAGRFEFDHADFEPPFTPERFVEAIRAGEQAGYAAIIVDLWARRLHNRIRANDALVAESEGRECD